MAIKAYAYPPPLELNGRWNAGKKGSKNVLNGPAIKRRFFFCGFPDVPHSLPPPPKYMDLRDTLFSPFSIMFWFMNFSFTRNKIVSAYSRIHVYIIT